MFSEIVGSIDWATTWPLLKAGFMTTLYWSTGASIAAIFIGMVGAYGQMSKIPLLQWLVNAYVLLFRNTPLLIQLFVFYRGLPAIGIVLPAELCGLLGLSLYTGAYVIEVFRSGLTAIPKEQLEASLSLGLSRVQTYLLILIPQAVRVILPPLGNQLISLFKNSSLLALITVTDLFYVVYKGAVDDFLPIPFFMIGALFYGVLSLSIAFLVHGIDRLLHHILYYRPPPRNPISPVEAV